MSEEISIEIYPEGTPLNGENSPPFPKRILEWLQLLGTIYSRFGNTAVEVNRLSWGGSALNRRSENDKRISELEAQLQTACEVAGLGIKAMVREDELKQKKEYWGCGKCDGVFDVDDLIPMDGEDGDLSWCAACIIESQEAQIEALKNPWISVDTGMPDYERDVVYRDDKGELYMFENGDEGDLFKMKEYGAVEWMYVPKGGDT